MCPFLEPRMESIPTAQGVGKRSSPQYNWELITEDWTKNRAGKKKKSETQMQTNKRSTAYGYK